MRTHTRTHMRTHTRTHMCVLGGGGLFVSGAREREQGGWSCLCERGNVCVCVRARARVCACMCVCVCTRARCATAPRWGRYGTDKDLEFFLIFSTEGFDALVDVRCYLLLQTRCHTKKKLVKKIDQKCFDQFFLLFSARRALMR